MSDKLEKQIQVLDDYLEGLLCVVFGDAGKHRGDVGDEKAVEDAHTQLRKLLRENLSLEANAFKPVSCGCNALFPAWRLGCGGLIESPHEVYRCVDCQTPFHKHCLHKHCKSEWDELKAQNKRLEDEIIGAHQCLHDMRVYGADNLSGRIIKAHGTQDELKTKLSTARGALSRIRAMHSAGISDEFFICEDAMKETI